MKNLLHNTINTTRWQWWIISLLIAIVVALPIVYVVRGFLLPTTEVWQHLTDTVLWSYISNSILLLVGTLSLSIVWGVGLAWITSRYRFWGYRFFSWFLALPLAIPTYIMAYAYQGIFSYTGPVYSVMQSIGINAAPIDIMHIPGLCLILSLVLYPYIYLTCRVAFTSGYRDLLEAGQSLGSGDKALFFKVMLPVARGAIAAGGFLVGMEILNDYGAMKYFGIPTFTTGIFSAWFDMRDLTSALRLAAILICTIFLLTTLEKRLRKGRRSSSGKVGQGIRKSVSRSTNVSLFLLCTAISLVSIGFPVFHLLSEAIHESYNEWFADLPVWIGNSALLGSISALVIVVGSTLLVFNEHIQLKSGSWLSRIAGIGYVVPGAVIALGVMHLGGGLFDKFEHIGVPTSYLLRGMCLLAIAYFIRFLAIGMSTTSSGFDTITKSLQQASLGLGSKPMKVLRTIHLPLAKRGIYSAAMLVFVDVIKELPLTLILRPFNFYTLATKTFEYADDEMLSRAALPALCIIALGAIPMYLAYRLSERV